MKKHITILLFILPWYAYTQTLTITSGIAETKTLWRMQYDNISNQLGHRYFEEPKQDVVVGLGLQYLQKEVWSLSSYVSYYESGGRLAVNDRHYSGAAFKWEIEDDQFDVPYLGFSTNVNFQLFSQNKISLDAILGAHVDYVLATQKAPDLYDYQDPLGFMHRQGALNRLNYGVNVGGQICIDLGRCVLGLQHIYAPRLRKLGSFVHNAEETSDAPRMDILELTVTEKAAFTQLTLGYKLKNKKQ